MKITETGWYDVMQGHLSRYPNWAVELGVYGLGGCLAGFLLKNFGRFMIGLIATLLLFLWFFAYLDIITFHLENLRALLGIQAIQTIDDGVRIYTEWAREHWAACLGSIIGFIIGWKWSP